MDSVAARFAVARWEDVTKCLTDPKIYSSSKFCRLCW